MAIGDPHGIGPEIALKALRQLSANERSLIKVYGPWSALEQAAQICQMESLLQDLIHEEAGSLAQPAQWGEITPQAGLSTVQSATAAIRACENGEVDAVIACPHHETAIHRA
ncbi:4-hydroxythreonine-4-phosphate dehydrogenase PdxA, partial [Comamonas thiooxydans]|uniref:1,2-dihydroxy-3,5-cyclohexadiene-1, 4-dicarboxylate dehydrogenase n=1 Tax=Comamonas thiooxydans TaxID=363952 RepID=UPI001F5F2697